MILGEYFLIDTNLPRNIFNQILHEKCPYMCELFQMFLNLGDLEMDMDMILSNRHDTKDHVCLILKFWLLLANFSLLIHEQWAIINLNFVYQSFL